MDSSLPLLYYELPLSETKEKKEKSISPKINLEKNKQSIEYKRSQCSTPPLSCANSTLITFSYFKSSSPV